MTASSRSQGSDGSEGFSFLTSVLKASQFRRIQEYLHEHTGIHLQDGKQQLVKSRLGKRLRALKLGSFDEYFEFLESDATGEETIHLVDVLTTNKTSFFREPEHLEFMRRHVLPDLHPHDPVRIWSAGCSTGQEPYTLAMFLCDEWKDLDRRDVRILATDISKQALARARLARYRASELVDVSSGTLERYFIPQPSGTASSGPAGRGTPVDGDIEDEGEETFAVHPRVTGLVRFARLNLMEEWPMKGLFNVIFCRNVMIYFDKATQERLVKRFWEVLQAGGYLFVGHSESLTSVEHPYTYVQPAVYRK